MYERVYQLHGDIARDGGRNELVLGDGLLISNGAAGRTRHPILTQRLSLEFDSDVPELIFRQTDDPSELYAALLNEVPGADPARIARARGELTNLPYHPLGIESGPFLQRLAHDLSSAGSYVEAGAPADPDAQLLILREPYIFLRKRDLGLVTALEGIKEDLKQRPAETLPASLLRIVGARPPVPTAVSTRETGESPRDAWANEDEHVLFSKPANAEQLQIARRLAQHGSVLVQGPPTAGRLWLPGLSLTLPQRLWRSRETGGA